MEVRGRGLRSGEEEGAERLCDERMLLALEKSSSDNRGHATCSYHLLHLRRPGPACIWPQLWHGALGVRGGVKGPAERDRCD